MTFLVIYDNFTEIYLFVKNKTVTNCNFNGMLNGFSFFHN